MGSPSSFDRRILVAACGMTPQIVTETLYALRVAASDSFAVNEIRLVTTADGKKQAVKLCVGGHMERLCKEYGFEDVRFDPSCIEVIRDAAGNELSDIRAPEHNRLAADCITDLVRRLTADDSAAIHVSLAGGRKTMGYYIGYALSLYGRSQDRLSHVLVSEGFEGHPEFYFPTQESRIITTAAGRSLDTHEAVVTLAEIPFVRLRDTLPPRLLAERTSFSEAVRWSNLDEEPVRLEIDLRERTLRASGELVVLSPVLLAFYTMFARAARDEDGDIEARDSNLHLTRSFAAELARCHGVADTDSGSFEGLLKQIEDDVDRRILDALRRTGTVNGTLRHLGIGKQYLEPKVSELGRVLEQELGSRMASIYRVHKRGRLGKGKGSIPLYGLALEPSQITIRD